MAYVRNEWEICLFHVLEFHFNKVAGFHTCNSIKKRLQRRRFVMMTKISHELFHKILLSCNGDYHRRNLPNH